MGLQKISEQTGIREEILRFALKMEEKLKENDHKGGWNNSSISYLLSGIERETEELSYAVGQEGQVYTRKDRSNIISECADVANFAMMLADNSVQDCL